MLVYSENEVFTGTPVPYNRMNANKAYLRHYENSLYLQFISQNGNMAERRQAAREMIICQRKMDYMYKHANFSLDAVLPEIEKLKKNWRKT